MEKQSEYRVNMREAIKNYLDERERMFKALNSDGVGDCPSVGKQSRESVISETNPSCFGTYEFGICERRSNLCGKNEKCRYATEHPMAEAKDDLTGIASPKPQNGTIEGTEDITLGDCNNEEIERQWQRIETSLAILRNLYTERANMEFWSRFEMVMKGMKL